ncbi:sialoadhesin-like [Salminus brasiliensis]|uniref:sialoadhesin-like n=1 Tax=Salminus brasiliensis TaxID=930266 RepID=UPI003B82E479
MIMISHKTKLASVWVTLHHPVVPPIRERKMEGLKVLRTLAEHHAEVLLPELHDVCLFKEVKVDTRTEEQREVKLTCSSTCSLNKSLSYYWFRNGEFKTYTADSSIVLQTSPSDEGSYYCRVSGSWHRSSPVCISADSDQKSCWSVTYYPKAICALIGSSASINCYYTYPDNQKVTKSVWFNKEQSGAEPVDVREDEEYQGRVQSRQSSQNHCSMIITDLRERDAQTYRFRFYTDGGKHTGQPGVTLTVTDMKITVSDTESGGKQLTCSSTCTLPDHHTYIWYKNGQSESHCRSASCSVAVVSGVVSYSCGVEGHESLHSSPVYSPRNTRAVLVPSGEREEGESVTLSCSFDADPPVLSYSWFKQRAAADTPLTIGQNYSITNISSQHSGHHSSTPVYLDVKDSPRNTRAVLLPSGEREEGESVTLSCSSDADPPVLSYSWFKQRAAADTPLTTGQNYSITNISSQHSGHHSSTPVYLDVYDSPRNTKAVLDSSGEREEGESVTLSCSSDADPPVLSYSWFKQRAAADTPLITGQNYSITNISSQHSGLYYCTAHNQLEHHSSTPFHLDVKAELLEQRAVWEDVWGAVGVVPVLLLSLTAVLCIKRRRGAERDTHIQTPNPADPTYTALNPTTISSDYDTLQCVGDSPCDTYSTLNPATMTSDYDSLTERIRRKLQEYMGENEPHD